MIHEALWMLRDTFGVHGSTRDRLAVLARRARLWKRFWSSFQEYNSLAPLGRQALLEHLYPCIGDDTELTIIEPIYFYQDWWAFDRILKNPPRSHVDVGFHHKFVALLSTVLPVTMVDIRPLSLPLPGLDFECGTIMDLPFDDDSVESLSSLCVVEHIGLGRYGDPLDPEGSEKAIDELKRVVASGGNLYLSFPLDDVDRIYFNAHRAFSHNHADSLVSPFDGTGPEIHLRKRFPR